MFLISLNILHYDVINIIHNILHYDVINITQYIT